MDYKEKYEQALEKAKELMNKGYDVLMPEIFPELKESEDERIRKWLIGYFQQYRIDGMEVVYADSLKVDDILAWLEKQSEKDPCTNCINDKGCITCENGNMKETEVTSKVKTLDPDKVIEWLHQNICTACFNEPDVELSQRIDKFKKDFEL